MPKHNIMLKVNSHSSMKLASRALYVIVGVIVVVFGLFWLIGFNSPYIEDPNFNAPLFTDAVLVLMMLMTACSIALVAWSAVRDARIMGRGESRSNNIPVRKIGYAVAAGTAIIMLFTFIIGSSTPMDINGVKYADSFWLKASDMFILTSGTLIVAAIAAVVYGSTKYIRKP